MSYIYPDAKLLVKGSSRNFRLGAVMSDESGSLWGITARHVFGLLASALVVDREGKLIGTYDQAYDCLPSGRTVSLGLLCRFKLEKGAVSPATVSFIRPWPRYALSESEMLGIGVVSASGLRQEIGNITEIGTTVNIDFPETGTSGRANDAIILSLDDDSVLSPGQAGTVLLSDEGDAIGLGIATRKTGSDTEVIAAPLRPYLERLNARLWVPPGSHWADLSRRTKNFLDVVDRDTKIDLGSAPDLNWIGRA